MGSGPGGFNGSGVALGNASAGADPGATGVGAGKTAVGTAVEGAAPTAATGTGVGTVDTGVPSAAGDVGAMDALPELAVVPLDGRTAATACEPRRVPTVAGRLSAELRRMRPGTGAPVPAGTMLSSSGPVTSL